MRRLWNWHDSTIIIASTIIRHPTVVSFNRFGEYTSFSPCTLMYPTPLAKGRVLTLNQILDWNWYIHFPIKHKIYYIDQNLSKNNTVFTLIIIQYLKKFSAYYVRKISLHNIFNNKQKILFLFQISTKCKVDHVYNNLCHFNVRIELWTA